jgi:L-alanine-DL-glutamate epimerase-like enolase superfamily enzyme|tara:strand:- start:214 stop:1329 length:1116 start_codon:yes stop_codon:yes gene_type:complete
MKITKIWIDVVERTIPDTGLDSDLGRFAGTTKQGLLRILTDEGIEGNCFIGNFRQGGRGLFRSILDVLKPELMGRDPGDREWLWKRLGILGSRKGLTANAWAPVDVALWDISGKASGLPIYKLLGSYQHETPVYATYPPRHDSPAGYLREAQELRELGFGAYKIHPGAMSTKNVIESVTLIRDFVGDSMNLMLDPNCGYSYRKALEVGRALDVNEFYWYEDPVPHYDLDAIKELDTRLMVPLCMSDQNPSQFFNSATMIRQQSVRIVRGTAQKLGITGLKKLCSMAEGFGLNCEIGQSGNPLLNAANLHVILSVSNCDYYEYWLPQEAQQFGLLNDITLNDRCSIEAPTLPGLGYEIDWDWISAHKIDSIG